MTPEKLRPIIVQELIKAGYSAQWALDEASRLISIILSKNLQPNDSTQTWNNNLLAKKMILDILRDYTAGVVKFTEEQIKKVWEIIEAKNDQMVIDKLLKVAGTTIIVSTLYRYLNRIQPQELNPRIMVVINEKLVWEVVKSKRNERALNAFVTRKIKGLNLSERVWYLTDKTVLPLIESYINSGIEKGISAKKISQELKQYLRDPDKLYRRVRAKDGNLRLSIAAKQYHPGQGVYRSAHMNALRLVREEINQAYRTADHERWNNLDFVRGVKVSLSNSHSTRMPQGDICDDLAGNYPKDFHFPGWHIQCLCYATPILMPEDDFIKSLVDEPVELNPVELPDNFNQYLKENQEKIDGWKSQPYWMKYNQNLLKNGKT